MIDSCTGFARKFSSSRAVPPPEIKVEFSAPGKLRAAARSGFPALPNPPASGT
jgi:hypothetical protein